MDELQGITSLISDILTKEECIIFKKEFRSYMKQNPLPFKIEKGKEGVVVKYDLTEYFKTNLNKIVSYSIFSLKLFSFPVLVHKINNFGR